MEQGLIVDEQTRTRDNVEASLLCTLSSPLVLRVRVRACLVGYHINRITFFDEK